MSNVKNLVKDVGKTLKNKPFNTVELVKNLHKISIDFKTHSVTLFDLRAKGTSHLSLVDSTKLNNDFFPCFK